MLKIKFEDMPKDLYECLKSISIVRCNAEYPTRMDMTEYKKQLFLLENDKGLFSVNCGLESQFDDASFTMTYKEAVKALARSVIEFGDKIKFNLLAIPTNGVNWCLLSISDHVIIRAVRTYVIATDQIYNRYDIMIEKVN